MFEQDTGKEQQDPLAYGVIATKKGPVGRVPVDRKNAKDKILFALLCYKQKLLEQPNISVENLQKYVNDNMKLLNKDSAVSHYTAPHYGFNTTQEAQQTISYAQMENNLIASIMFALCGEQTSIEELEGNENNNAPIICNSVSRNGDNVKINLTSDALKNILKFSKNLYKDDKIFLEKLQEIQDAEAINLNQLKARKEEMKNSLKSPYELKPFFQNSSIDSNLKKIMKGDICIGYDAGGVFLNNSNFVAEKKNVLGGGAGLIGYYQQKDANGVMRRYYLNKDTGYVFETDDKDFEYLGYLDDGSPFYSEHVRVFTGKQWNDDCHILPYDDGLHNTDRRHVIHFTNDGKDTVVCTIDGQCVYSTPSDIKNNKMAKTKTKELARQLLDDIKKNGLKHKDDNSFTLTDRQLEIYFDLFFPERRAHPIRGFFRKLKLGSSHGKLVAPRWATDQDINYFISLLDLISNQGLNIITVNSRTGYNTFHEIYKTAPNQLRKFMPKNLCAEKYIDGKLNITNAVENNIHTNIFEKLADKLYSTNGIPHEGNATIPRFDEIKSEILTEKVNNNDLTPVSVDDIIAKIEENKKKYKSLADEYEKPDNKVYSTDLAQEAFKRLPDLKTKENQEQDPEYQAKLQKQIKKMEKARLKQAKEDRLKLERDYKKQLQEAVDDLSNVKEKNIFERILHFLFGFFEEDYNKYDEAINTIRKVNTFLGVDEKNASIVDNAVKNAEDRLFIDEENRAKIQYQVKISLDDIGNKRARQ